MISSTDSAPTSSWRTVSLSRIALFASMVFCGFLPVLTVVALFVTVVRDDSVAFDFRPFYSAAESILRGESPYPAQGDPLTASAGPYVYPPLGALGAIPLSILPREAAGLLVMTVLLAAALATLAVLGVRDWRCYGLALLWPPVLSAVQTGNVTLLLGLGAALAWRLRDRGASSGTSVGLTLAAKLFLWPLVGWLAATRRFGAALLACAVGAGLVVMSWAAIGFAGLREYPDLLRRLEDTVGLDSYTLFVVGLDLGLRESAARALWLAVGLGILAGMAILGHRGADRSAFILAIAAALALSPLVWLHYFALLLVVAALARPTLGLMWFVPLAMFASPGSGNPTVFEEGVVLGTTALTIALALRVIRKAPQVERVGTGSGASRARVTAGVA